jgi:hypothetical protein
LLKAVTNIIIALCICINAVGQFQDYSSIWTIPSGAYDAYFGNGVSVFDYDQDNKDDITIAQPYLGISTFHVENNVLVPDLFLPLPLNLKQLIWADFNNDGDKELFVTAYGGGLYLFDYEEGQLTQIEGSFSSSIFGYFYGASAADFDNDGDLDLFVCQYFNYQFIGSYPNLLFRNDGDFNFVEVGEIFGVNAVTNNSFQSVWLDFNRDGWQDLYVINDKNVPNLFYQNNNGSSFSEIAMLNNSNIAMSCMSNSISDYNRDGYFDVFITDGVTPVLLEGDGSGIFSEVANDVGFEPFETGWGALWIDDDLDGWDDLHICQGGTVYTPMYNQYYKNNQGNFLFSNSFDSTFKVSFVNAKGDFDGDCIADFIVMNASPNSYDLWKGLPSNNNYLKIALEGTISNPDAVGAIVEVYTNAELGMKALLFGDNYISQNSGDLIFGIGNAEIVDSVRVFWPRGLVEKFYAIEPNQSYVIVEGSNEMNNVNVLEYNLSFCYTEEAIEIVPESQWIHWQWQDGNADVPAFINSDTTLYAVAWNNPSETVEMIFFVDVSAERPYLVLNQSNCSNHPNTLSFDVNTEWNVYLNQNVLLNEFVELEPGSYQVTFTHDNGCSFDTTIYFYESNSVIINKEVFPSCPSDLVNYAINTTAGTADNLSISGLVGWNGSLPPGIYPFVLLDEDNSCSYEDTLIIVGREFPDISVMNDSICESQLSSLEIEVSNVDSSDWFVVNSLYQDQDSLLTVTVQDSFGCIYSEDISVLISSTISITPIEQTINGQEILNLNITGGTPPYEIQWSDFSTGSSYVLAPDEWLGFEVTDAIGCSVTGSYFNQLSDGIFDVSEGLELYFNGDFLMCLNCSNQSYSILTINGTAVDFGRFNTEYIDLGRLSSGVYLIEVDNRVLKFVK